MGPSGSTIRINKKNAEAQTHRGLKNKKLKIKNSLRLSDFAFGKS